MNYKTAYEKLLNHGNLTNDLPNAIDQESILFVLWNANQSKIAPVNLATMTKDIVDCLEVVNKHWNSEIPSKTFDGAEEIDRYLVSAISYITHGCWQCFLEWQKTRIFETEVLRQLSITAWTISCAWNAVLAGDIDDISEDIEGEKIGTDIF